MAGAGSRDEERRYLRDVQDHALRIAEQVDGFRAAAAEHPQRQPHARDEGAQRGVASRQNEEVKKISAWAAILFAPTLVGTIYGMNFDHMPELHWALGYPFALGLMLACAWTLYFVFKRSKWIWFAPPA